MGMPMIDGDISTIDPEELKQIKDKNKNVLYARAVHTDHMIQHHMHEISERQQVVDEYQSMIDGGREMIPLESDQYKNDLVINQHIMQMIDTDIFWYRETFRAILMELWKICNGETAMKTCEELNEKESYESAMMCLESLDDSEQTSKKRKTHSQSEAMNDKADGMDDKRHNLNIPVDDLQLRADDYALTLATWETSAKNLVYMTNIPEGKLDRMENLRDSNKNSGEQDGKKCSPLEKSNQVTSNDKLNAYGESERDAKMEKGKEHKSNTWRMRKIIHMEFESDDDVAEQSKNANDAKTESKVRVTKKTVHYYEFSSEEEEGEHAEPKKIKKTQDGQENPSKNDENDQALVSNEMTLSSIGNDIFIDDSAATSHITNNKTGVYDLIPIRGSVMIGNGESISCTPKGKLDVICKHKDGSIAKQTWKVKIVPQSNHDLFSFTKAIKEGWQMNGRWKEGGLMIELFKTTKTSMKFDRMVPSGSSWLMGIKTQRLVGQAHAVIEPGKSIPIWNCTK